jgi:hypothetical protein
MNRVQTIGSFIMKKLTKSLLVTSVFSLFLVACGGDKDAAAPAPAPAPTPAPTSEGTPAAPVMVTIGVPRASSVSAYGTSYYSFVATSASTATISLTNTQSDLTWVLFSDSTYTTIVDLCDNFPTPGSANETCTTPALANGATYYLMVDEWDTIAGTFTQTVVQP